MQDRIKSSILILKKWFQVLSEEEKEALEDINLPNVSKKEIIENLNTYDAIDADKDWKKLELAIENISIKKPIPAIHLVKHWGKYAAILCALLASSYVLFFNNQSVNNSVVAANPLNQVQLTINNKSQQFFFPNKTQKITNKSGEQIAMQIGKELKYNREESITKSDVHELSVPYGQTFRVVLSDGTIVYCDAGTTLTYPSYFPLQGERKVQIQGQAFFDVAKSKTQPFIVNTKYMDIQVLGTQFNVSAYPEDDSVSAVLVEGSVAIKPLLEKSLKEIVKIIPNQRAVLNPDFNKVKVQTVNTFDYTSWISGKLIFKRSAFESILKTLSRKYNVTIINENPILAKQTFTATFDIESLEDILRVFQEDTPFTYTRKGNTIIIH